MNALTVGSLTSLMLNATYGTLMVVVAVLMLSLLSEQHLRVETERLARENEKLGAELERMRIAREIHDTLGHSLTSLKLQLELADRLIDSDPEKARAALTQAEGLAARSLTDTRVALQSMRQAQFDFVPAVRQLVAEVEANSQLQVHLQLAETLPPPPPPVAYQLCVARIIDEHAQARKRHRGICRASR
jgi:signal transduction histidine kinase